jgi:hypothetical protein
VVSVIERERRSSDGSSASQEVAPLDERDVLPREAPPAISPSVPPLLVLVLDVLQHRLRTLVKEPALLRAFAGWLGIGPNASSPSLLALGHEAAARSEGARNYRDIATLGYVLARVSTEVAVNAAFGDGILWLARRRFFVPTQPLTFEVDGVALLGTALGIASLDGPTQAALDAALDGESVHAWLSKVLGQGRARLRSTDWSAGLLTAAQHVLDRKMGDVDASARSGASHLRPSPDLELALAAQGWYETDVAAEQQARQMIVDLAVDELPLDQAVVRWVALRWLLRQGASAVPHRASASDVIEVLRGIPHALRRWPWEDTPRTKGAGVTAQQWDVQHEYHVQSLLWAVLAPLFPHDLEDEEYLQSLGHKHPRTDLLIPSLRLIIEAKVLRVGTQQGCAKLIEEIAADTALYRVGTTALHEIVVFVWDNSRSTDQYGELEQGIRRLSGIRDVVIIPRPGRWDSPDPTMSSSRRPS